MPSPTSLDPAGSIRLVTTELGETVLLDRPARRNALTVPLWRALAETVRTAGATTTAPLYVAGAGGYFCSGADLGSLGWARSAPERAEEFVHTVVEALLTIHLVPREVIAVVDGGAAGGGVEIMAACDRRIAIGEPTLVFPFGHHGMQLDDFTRWRLHQLVGDAEAERLVDGRHVVLTDEACRLGLFDEQRPDLATQPAQDDRDSVDAGVTRHTGTFGDQPRYAAGLDDLPAAVARAAQPMLAAFRPT
ncbi:enoyl-CoA hydratase/isomerase family protein [Ornithinimicrobium sp. Y1694]|uniref:enoyl-CoA hydratase/isomerase family protein n=1 Tax=Ornithinimicrobium sp. Y1694 TaxID=3418590 RepID=UPI003CE9B91B